MLRIIILITLLIPAFSWGQNHAENLETINTEEEAEDYASGFQEVFTGTVNIESDVFFFDDIDTSNLEAHVGTLKSSYGKTSKLIKDSMFNIVNVQVIRFDLKKISPETAEILMSQMKKLLDRGDSYWDVKERFAHTSAKCSSSPQIVEEVSEEYNILESQMTENAYFEWVRDGDSAGIVIIEKEPHEVPGFFTISFINLNNGNIR
mmetsp:Transcript_11240/g.15155  ORF Transcript_11240/g.15155 Transcript_11240/m.15155 type:complete len:206 (+) Transcript_11240:28-645(+)